MSKIKIHIGENFQTHLIQNGDDDRFNKLMKEKYFDLLDEIFAYYNFADHCEKDNTIDICFCSTYDLSPIAEYLSRYNEEIVCAFDSRGTDVVWFYDPNHTNGIIVVLFSGYIYNDETIEQALDDMVEKARMLSHNT